MRGGIVELELRGRDAAVVNVELEAAVDELGRRAGEPAGAASRRRTSRRGAVTVSRTMPRPGAAAVIW